MLLIIMIVLSGWLPAAASAGDISRDEAVQYALTHADEMDIASQTSESLKAGGDELTAFTNPLLSLDSGYFELGNNQADIPIPGFESPERNIAASITLSRVLYAGGRIDNSRSLKEVMTQEGDDAEKNTRRGLIKNVKLAFDAVLFREAAIDILSDRLNQRKNELEDAEDIYAVGLVTSLDVRQAKLSIQFAKTALDEGRMEYDKAVIDFNRVIGKPEAEESMAPKGDLTTAWDHAPVIKRMNNALKNETFFDINALKNQMEAARLTYEIKRGAAKPEVNFVSALENSGEEPDDIRQSWSIGVKLTWNILDGGLVDAQKRGAMADYRKTTSQLSRLKKDLKSAVDTLIANIDSINRRIELQKESVDLAKANYEDARGQYRAGTITLTQLGDFNLAYSEARFNLLMLFYAKRNVLSEAEALLEFSAE